MTEDQFQWQMISASVNLYPITEVTRKPANMSVCLPYCGYQWSPAWLLCKVPTQIDNYNSSASCDLKLWKAPKLQESKKVIRFRKCNRDMPRITTITTEAAIIRHWCQRKRAPDFVLWDHLFMSGNIFQLSPKPEPAWSSCIQTTLRSPLCPGVFSVGFVESFSLKDFSLT